MIARRILSFFNHRQFGRCCYRRAAGTTRITNRQRILYISIAICGEFDFIVTGIGKQANGQIENIVCRRTISGIGCSRTEVVVRKAAAGIAAGQNSIVHLDLIYFSQICCEVRCIQTGEAETIVGIRSRITGIGFLFSAGNRRCGFCSFRRFCINRKLCRQRLTIVLCRNSNRMLTGRYVIQRDGFVILADYIISRFGTVTVISVSTDVRFVIQLNRCQILEEITVRAIYREYDRLARFGSLGNRQRKVFL